MVSRNSFSSRNLLYFVTEVSQFSKHESSYHIGPNIRQLKISPFGVFTEDNEKFRKCNKDIINSQTVSYKTKKQYI
jgi:hypothetical protein